MKVKIKRHLIESVVREVILEQSLDKMNLRQRVRMGQVNVVSRIVGFLKKFISQKKARSMLKKLSMMPGGRQAIRSARQKIRQWFPHSSNDPVTIYAVARAVKRGV